MRFQCLAVFVPAKRLLLCGFLTLVFGLANVVGQDEQPRPEGDPLMSVGSGAAALDLGAVSSVDIAAPAAPVIPLASSGVDKRFDGFNFNDNATENGGFVFIPPDPIGAAGKNLVIAVANTMIEARNKGGALKWRTSLQNFFSPLGAQTLGTFTFDPKIVYDHYRDRFLVVTLERTDVVFGAPSDESRILLAVSRDGNPQTPADWDLQAIDSKTIVSGFATWADYPGFEVDEEAVYVTANLFTFFFPLGGFFYGGSRLWIVDKGEGAGGLYDGGASVVTVHNPYAGGGISTTTMPSLVYGDGGVGGPGSTLGTFLVSYSGLTVGGLGPEAVQVVTVDDPLGTIGGPFFTQQFIFVGDLEGPAFPALPDAPQLGSATPIEVNDRRALDAVWRDDSLWFTTTLQPNAGPDLGQTTAHWFRLDTTAGAGAVVLADQGNIGGEDIAPATTTFFPSVAVNRNGFVKFGFSGSAASIYASAFVTGRGPSDPVGTVGPSELVRAGEDFYVRTFGSGRNRWGDYSGIALDPTDDKFFWVFNEYASTRGTVIGGEDGRWGTAWARCKAP